MKYSATVHTEGASQAGALPDILISDGQIITMRFMQYNLSLEQSKESKKKTIVANTGLLEDCWGHRWNWMLGSGDSFGKLLVFDAGMTYGVQTYYTFLKHDNTMHPDTHTGHLHQKYARYTIEQFPIGTRLFAQENNKQKNRNLNRKRRLNLDTNTHLWNKKSLIQFRALVLADNALLGAGWKDSVTIYDEDSNRRRNSVLQVMSTADGETINEYPLTAEPVFDGMAAAYGKMYLSLKDGTILCMGADL